MQRYLIAAVVVFSIVTVFSNPVFLKHRSTPIPLFNEFEYSTSSKDLESKDLKTHTPIEEREKFSERPRVQRIDQQRHSTDLLPLSSEKKKFRSTPIMDRVLMEMWSSPMPIRELVSDHSVKISEKEAIDRTEKYDISLSSVKPLDLKEKEDKRVSKMPKDMI